MLEFITKESDKERDEKAIRDMLKSVNDRASNTGMQVCTYIIALEVIHGPNVLRANRVHVSEDFDSLIQRVTKKYVRFVYNLSNRDENTYKLYEQEIYKEYDIEDKGIMNELDELATRLYNLEKELTTLHAFCHFYTFCLDRRKAEKQLKAIHDKLEEFVGVFERIVALTKTIAETAAKKDPITNLLMNMFGKSND